MRTPISSSQCSWYCPKGMVASVACWKTFFVSSARARACMWCSSLVVRRDTDELRGISTRPRVPGRMTIADGPDHAWPFACCLPSGLSPSVLEFHQVNRPLAADGSRTFTAGSEFHRPRSTPFTPISQCATRHIPGPARGVHTAPGPDGGRPSGRRRAELVADAVLGDQALPVVRAELAPDPAHVDVHRAAVPHTGRPS